MSNWEMYRTKEETEKGHHSDNTAHYLYTGKRDGKWKSRFCISVHPLPEGATPYVQSYRREFVLVLTHLVKLSSSSTPTCAVPYCLEQNTTTASPMPTNTAHMPSISMPTLQSSYSSYKQPTLEYNYNYKAVQYMESLDM